MWERERERKRESQRDNITDSLSNFDARTRFHLFDTARTFELGPCCLYAAQVDVCVRLSWRRSVWKRQDGLLIRLKTTTTIFNDGELVLSWVYTYIFHSGFAESPNKMNTYTYTCISRLPLDAFCWYHLWHVIEEVEPQAQTHWQSYIVLYVWCSTCGSTQIELSNTNTVYSVHTSTQKLLCAAAIDSAESTFLSIVPEKILSAGGGSCVRIICSVCASILLHVCVCAHCCWSNLEYTNIMLESCTESYTSDSGTLTCFRHVLCL